MEDLRGLNAEQRQAVEYIGGPLLILAGPGSGKTRVVTHRIAYLINVCGVRPYNILAVTFTNKAAREMTERLRELAPKDAEYLTIGTFHATCSRLLRREAHNIGLDSRYIIYDDDDQYSLVRKVLKEFNLDEKAYSPRALLSGISKAKSELVSPLQYAEYASGYWEEVVGRVYRRYQETLAENNGLDFDDLLMTTARLFRERPDVLERYQSRYVHLLVDEFQDTNMAQYSLVKMLADKHRNICVVGDEDQSIYSWRQADIRNILRFESDFSDARTVYLEQNYRSTKTILNAARSVIAINSMRKDKHLWTQNDEGLPIVVFEAYNEEDEANYVVREIERLIARSDTIAGSKGIGAGGRYQPRDFAVMYRANAQSRVLERAFILRKMPHKLVGVRFYQRKEIKDIIAYLRVIYNPYDTVSLNRIINVPSRALGSRTLTELERWAHDLGIGVWDALHLLRDKEISGPDSAAAAAPFNARAQQALLKALSLFEEFIAAAQRLSLPRLIDLVIRESGYEELLKEDGSEGEERLQNVRELLTVADQYAQLDPQVGLASFLEEAALATDVDGYDEKENAVTLITLHGAKGLEFRVVFVVGMEEGICPHSRSLQDQMSMEEERRLCYVGMTRARERLYLVHAYRRAIYGNTSLTMRSRFIDDIPANFIKETDGGSRRESTLSRGPSPSRPVLPVWAESQLRWTPAIKQAPKREAQEVRRQDIESSRGAEKARADIPNDPAFEAGDQVKHSTFGEGIVVSVKVVDGDQEVSVAFPQIGVKRLSLAYARLEKVDAT